MGHLVISYTRNLQFSSLHDIIKNIGEQTTRYLYIYICSFHSYFYQPRNFVGHVCVETNLSTRKLTYPVRIDGWKMKFVFLKCPFHGLCLIFGGVGVSTFEKHQAVLFGEEKMALPTPKKNIGSKSCSKAALYPPGELTYPTEGKGKFSAKCGFIGDMLVRKNSEATLILSYE